MKSWVPGSEQGKAGRGEAGALGGVSGWVWGCQQCCMELEDPPLLTCSVPV